MAVGRSKPVARISFWKKLVLDTLYATVLSVLVEPRLALPAASVAAPAGTLATTVPAARHPRHRHVVRGPTPGHRRRRGPRRVPLSSRRSR